MVKRYVQIHAVFAEKCVCDYAHAAVCHVAPDNVSGRLRIRAAHYAVDIVKHLINRKLIFRGNGISVAVKIYVAALTALPVFFGTFGFRSGINHFVVSVRAPGMGFCCNNIGHSLHSLRVFKLAVAPRAFPILDISGLCAGCRFRLYVLRQVVSELAFRNVFRSSFGLSLAVLKNQIAAAAYPVSAIAVFGAGCRNRFNFR